MFGGEKFSVDRLKTNLKLVIVRSKVLQTKKLEISKRLRKEIANYISLEKIERARIKTEQLIREDYLVEAYEMIENYCDALISAIGLIKFKTNVDESIFELVVTMIWVAPRLCNDLPELNVISRQLELKFGQKFHDTARCNGLKAVPQRMVDCLRLTPPSSLLIEKYLKVIAETFSLKYEPGPTLDKDDMCTSSKIDMNSVYKIAKHMSEPTILDSTPVSVDNSYRDIHVDNDPFCLDKIYSSESSFSREIPEENTTSKPNTSLDSTTSNFDNLSPLLFEQIGSKNSSGQASEITEADFEEYIKSLAKKS